MYDESPPKLVPSTVTAPPAAGSVEGRVATTCRARAKARAKESAQAGRRAQQMQQMPPFPFGGGGTHPRSTLDISARKPASAAARQVVLASRSAPSLRDPTRREGLQRIIGECLRRVVGEVDRP
jgi:hypothetical protein